MKSHDHYPTENSQINQLKPGEIINNKKLRDIFQVGIQGGMRRSKKTNSLVLISDHTKSIYEDRWIDETFHYTGMGLKGDQDLNFLQNKTLAQSNTNGVKVYFFEVFEKGKYLFIGEVYLASDPYTEKQPDINDNLRDVYIFPLRAKNDEPVPIHDFLLKKKDEALQKRAKKLSNTELEERARTSIKNSGSREVSTKSYYRDPYVKEHAKRRANGFCQFCGKKAPFNNKDDTPYLETHHIIWLSEGGEDTIENTVALCPNCHRRMHVLNSKTDIESLKKVSRCPHGLNKFFD